MSYFITAGWLKEKIDAGEAQAGKLVIVDARYVLTNSEAGSDAYKESHIPGAYYLSLSRHLSGPCLADGTGGRHPLPAPSDFAAIVQRIGISNDTTVIGYDDQGGAMASRLRWLLQWTGHTGDVFILEGGFAKWQEEGYTVTSEVPAYVSNIIYDFKTCNSMLVSRQYVLSKLGQEGTAIIDSREASRYRGEVEPLDPAAGHIPGAVNRFWAEGRRADGTWKSSAEQAERFAGLSVDDEIIVYCGSGVTATPNYFALQEAGFKNVKLYAGSWSDWSSDKENPVAVGDGEKE